MHISLQQLQIAFLLLYYDELVTSSAFSADILIPITVACTIVIFVHTLNMIMDASNARLALLPTENCTVTNFTVLFRTPMVSCATFLPEDDLVRNKLFVFYTKFRNVVFDT